MIEVKGLFAGYGKKPVLQDVDLTVKKGKITTVLGTNGSGKSTLLKVLNGSLPVDQGQIVIGKEPAQTMSRSQRARLMAYLPQGKNVPDITVGRLVLHGRFPHLGYPRRYSDKDMQIASAAMRCMEVEQWEHLPVAALSGGMRQRVYLAMILAQQSPIILMDEPTTYLDLGQQMKFVRLLRELTEQGKTLLLVLHDILLALKVSDQIVVMDKGKVIASGTPEEILERHVLEELYGVYIGSVDGQYYSCVD